MLDNANYKWYHMKTWTDSYIVSNFLLAKLPLGQNVLKMPKEISNMGVTIYVYG